MALFGRYCLAAWVLLWPWMAPWTYGTVVCPFECHCSENVVTCNHKGLNRVPENVPDGTSRLELEGNHLKKLRTFDFENLQNLHFLSLLNDNITVIEDDTFKSLEKLRTLLLNSNQLEYLPEALFIHNRHLRRLDLSGNLLRRVSKQIFKGIENLEILQLDNNEIKCLPLDTFENLWQLEILTLHNNKLQTLPAGIFTPLKQLKNIHLSNNELHCDCHLGWLSTWLRFRMGSLFTRCHAPYGLKGKEISEIDQSAFICNSPLPHDEGCPTINTCPEPCSCSSSIVDCRDKGLTSIPSHIPEDTTELRLEQNKITSIPARAFSPFRQLRRIDLSNNQITSIAGDAFQGLKLLTSLVLYANKITDLEPQAFSGLTSLQLLLLNANKITCLRRNALDDLRNLNLLSLYDNQLKTIPNGTFNSLASIQTLHLGRNPFVCDCSLQWLSDYLEISPIETSGARCEYPRRLERRKLTALRDENLKCTDDTVNKYAGECVSADECPKGCSCRGTIVDCTAAGLTSIPKSMPEYTTNLILSDNEIRELTRSQPLLKLTRLKRLVLANNQLRIITTNALQGMSSLEELDLSENDITELTPHMIGGLSSLRTLNLAGNRITCMSPGAFSALPHLKQINLEGNPLICNCHLSWLAKWFRRRGIYKMLPRCHSPSHLRDATITEVPSSSFVCSENEVGCNGIVQECPKKCKCEGTIVRCSKANLRTIPTDIPAHTTELYLDFNSITEVDPSKLSHLKSLTRLDLSNNIITVLENNTFAGLSELSALIVSYSKVQCIQRDTLSGLRNLRILSLHGNDISIIPEGSFRDLDLLTHIALGANPLYCDCGLAWLAKWIKLQFVEPGIARCAEPTNMRDKLVLTTPTTAFQCAAKVPNEVLAKCDQCYTFPCENSGTCISLPNRKYRCECPPAYHGYKCQYKIDACYGNPCENQGTCKVLEAGRFSCHCPKGFEGSRCEMNIDDCKDNKCEHNSTCVDLIEEYRCRCRPGYTGDYCETKIPFCTKEFNPCKNGANCVDHFTHYTCECPVGFAGDNCTLNIDDCVNHLCQNEASCVDGINEYTCKCVGDYYGKFCEVGPAAYQQTSPCQQNDCKNGICFVPPNSQDYICKCSPGFSGKHCEYLTRVHFGANNSFLALDPLQTIPTSNLTMHIKTKKESGVLVYFGKQAHLAVELFLGRIRVSFDVGNHPVSNMFSYEVVSDGEWHTVELLTKKQNFTMRIDGGSSRWILNHGKKDFLDLDVPLFIGGLPQDVATKAVESYHVRDSSSFNGCMQKVYIDGRLKDLSSGKQHKTTAGCNGEEAISDEGNVLSFKPKKKATYKPKRGKTNIWTKDSVRQDLQVHPPIIVDDYSPKEDVCDSHKCRRGRCKAKKHNPFEYRCHCRTGWSGKFCDQAPTCRKEQFTEYYVENECRSRKPIKNALCSGTCGKHCCKPRKTKQRKVRLICNDGTSYRKQIEIIRKCRCIRRCY